MRSAIVLLLFVFGTASSFAEGDHKINMTCGSGTSEVAYNYCYFPSEDHGDELLYVFHGLGGNEQFWHQSGLHAGFVQATRYLQKNVPSIVVVSLGPDWLLNEFKDGSGLLNDFLTQIIPNIEGTVLTHEVHSRRALGFSMGGGNAGQIALKAPEVFESVALICPAIFKLVPYGSERRVKKKIAKYMRRTRATEELTNTIVHYQRKYFPKRFDWYRSAPLHQAKKRLEAGVSPAMYISTNASDDFGFQYDTKKFFDIAVDKGVHAEYQSLAGEHCKNTPVLQIAEFLSREEYN